MLSMGEIPGLLFKRPGVSYRGVGSPVWGFSCWGRKWGTFGMEGTKGYLNLYVDPLPCSSS